MLSLIFILSLTIYIWLRFISHPEVAIINKIPGPRSILRPLIGNVYLFNTTTDKMWTLARKMADDYYPIFRLWRFGSPIVLTRDPDDIEIVLTSTKHITKGPMYDYLHPWLGTGLLTSTGQKWKNRRKIMTPAFHFNILNEFIEVFEVQADQLITSIMNKGAGIIDIIPMYSKFTLNTICETAMGTRLEDEDERQIEFREAVHIMGHLVFHLSLNPWDRLGALFSLLPMGRLQAKVLKVLHNFSNRIIGERKRYHEENDVADIAKIADEENVNRYAEESKKRVALLDLLIQVWNKGLIDNTGIREEVDTFIFEGHDTTAVSLIFTTLLLAENKECQEEARREVDAAFNNCPGKLGMAELQGLNYLEKCIKESLRLYPSVHGISRMTEEDLKLKNYMIPKGSDIHILIYDLHRDPKYWQNPDKFDPERFNPESVRKRHRFSYIPFSAGPRNCIGQKFAMLELKSSIAHILRNFYLEPVDPTKNITLQVDLVIRSTHPLRINFIPRNL